MASSSGRVSRDDEDARDALCSLLRTSLDLSRETYVSPTFLAWMHLAREEVDEAIEYLEKALEGGDPWISMLRIYAPTYPRTPRLEAILERIGLSAV